MTTLAKATLVPELVVTNIARSIAFWCGLVGFAVRYDRPEEGFAYLGLGGADVMLDEYRPGCRYWLTRPLDPPLGNGMNLQIEVPAVAPILDHDVFSSHRAKDMNVIGFSKLEHDVTQKPVPTFWHHALDALASAAWPLVMPVEAAWYRSGDQEIGQRQFVVADPDGYMLRLAEPLGLRPLAAGRR